MNVGTLISETEYLRASYPPEVEFRDGVLLTRNVGDEAHSWLQTLLSSYLVFRRTLWKIKPYIALRIRVRKGWHPTPDVWVYPEPGFHGRYPSVPPLLWIEILSDDDKMVEVWERANELLHWGVPYIWIIDPNTLESELRTRSGVTQVPDKTLHIPDTLIVIRLLDVVKPVEPEA